MSGVWTIRATKGSEIVRLERAHVLDALRLLMRLQGRGWAVAVRHWPSVEAVS